MVPWSPQTATAAVNNGPNQKKKVVAGKMLPLSSNNSIGSNTNNISSSSSSNTNSNNNNNNNNNNNTGWNAGGPGFHHGAHDSSHDSASLERCRSCNSSSIVTDWKQGDRVCTRCGVVAEERLRDDRPEWKNFCEAEDIVKNKGAPSNARSGLVAVDETRYVGGLQPTLLSTDAFGANVGGYKLANIRKQLKTTNRRLDHLVQKAHKRALQDARLERRVRLKMEKTNSASNGNTNSNTNSNSNEEHDHDTHDPIGRPEFDMVVLQEEEDLNRLQAAIYADKWSLDRAIFLHGNSTEETDAAATATATGSGTANREDLLSTMDKPLRDASRDLYTAYAMITRAARTLTLPNRVVDESVHRLVQYAVRRDGFSVRGVSSRLPKAANANTNNGKEDKDQRKIAAKRLREYNKAKQISSLGAAILFLTARNLGWTRTVLETCDCFRPSLEHPSNNNEATDTATATTTIVSIKAKHCFRAINEIKTYFPEYTRKPAAGDPNSNHSRSTTTHTTTTTTTTTTATTTNDDSIYVSASNFADHFVRNLHLPPVAEASVRALLVHCRHEQITLGHNSGTKMATLCATVVYFVCTAGAAMQKAAERQVNGNGNSNGNGSAASPQRAESLKNARKDATTTTTTIPIGSTKDDSNTNSDTSDEDEDDDSNIDNDNDAKPFDVFTHGPIVDNQVETLEYEMRRMWDAWAKQMPWSRSLLQIEQACGNNNVSINTVLKLYKSDLYPRRERLLDVLFKAAVGVGVAVAVEAVGGSNSKNESESCVASHSSLGQTPMASILLAHISTAGALMSSK